MDVEHGAALQDIQTVTVKSSTTSTGVMATSHKLDTEGLF